MEKFVKYLTESEQDTKWGMTMTVAGKTKIPNGTAYPPSPDGHPAKYRFSWDNGRVLMDYQMIYITRGEGQFESAKSKLQNISAGHVFFLFPGIWHRYRCSIKTGWDEYYIGFKGNFINQLSEVGFIDPEKPVLYIGYKEKFLQLFQDIFNAAENENTGYQQLASGAIQHLIGAIYSTYKNKDFAGKTIEKKINQAKLNIASYIYHEMDGEKIASELNVGYSWFRKKFKEYTGMAPGQYHIQLRINKAKEELLSTQKPIKKIAYELGFESNHYFSRIFSKKTGLSPQGYRNWHKT